MNVERGTNTMLFSYDRIKSADVKKMAKLRASQAEYDYSQEISCIPQVTVREPNLNGRNVIVACIDSGIDIYSPEFQTVDGQTRIIGLWDQTVNADEEKGFQPPEGYATGVYFSREQINTALAAGRERGEEIVPSRDTSGHGTAVAGIAAGSLSGVAKQADILVVKLGVPLENNFPRTTQLMRGIDFAVKEGLRRNRPVAINVSFGNTYGDHRGESLLERFIDNASEIGKNVIVIGSGNEGASNGHCAGRTEENRVIELTVGAYETGLSIQYWKHFQDVFKLRIVSPGGEEVLLDSSRMETIRATLEQTELLCFIGEPQPYSVNQEIYIDFIPSDRYINSGVWRLELIPVQVVTGEYRFFLPSYVARNAGTGFLLPTPEVTLTIPSTALRAITVGAYDGQRRSYADFSGRGYVYRYEEGRVTREGVPYGVAFSKPDLVAPGVGIRVPVPQGGYENVSGTSFATPLVTGSAALLMEWGIVRGNDPYMYGQRLKAYLIKGAVQLPGYEVTPNGMTGWGALCVEGSLKG